MKWGGRITLSLVLNVLGTIKISTRKWSRGGWNFESGFQNKINGRDINIWLVAKNSSVDYITQVERKPVTNSQDWPIFKVQKEKKTYSKSSLICRYFPWSSTVADGPPLTYPQSVNSSLISQCHHSPHFVSSHRHFIISSSQEGWANYNKLFWEQDHIYNIFIIVYCITVLFYY